MHGQACGRCGQGQSILHNGISFSLRLCCWCWTRLTSLWFRVLHLSLATPLPLCAVPQYLFWFVFFGASQLRLMSTTSAQGHIDSESATNLRTNQAISSALPPRHTYLPPPPSNSHPQPPFQNSQNLYDMPSLSSVPRYA